MNRWHAFFQRQAVHHRSRFSMPYTFRHFLPSPRGFLQDKGETASVGGLSGRATEGSASPEGRRKGKQHKGSVPSHLMRPRRFAASTRGLTVCCCHSQAPIRPLADVPIWPLPHSELNTRAREAPVGSTTLSSRSTRALEHALASSLRCVEFRAVIP